MTQAQSVFSNIYKTNAWGYGSGVGSLEINTRGYREFLQNFLKEYKIKSVVDLGCGDWQIASLINWDKIHYTGIDVVDTVIEKDKELYGSDQVEFYCFDVLTQELPTADLLIIKDVLQHWPNKDILDFLPRLSSFKYALITNCILGNYVNVDIPLGIFRPLNLSTPPFNCDFPQVYSFTNYSGEVAWKKVVYLYSAEQSTLKP